MGTSRVLPCISDADMVALCRLDQARSAIEKVKAMDDKAYERAQSAIEKVKKMDDKTYERLVDLGYAGKDDRTGFRSITTLGISYIEGELHEEADSEDAAWKLYASFASSFAALGVSFFALFITALPGPAAAFSVLFTALLIFVVAGLILFSICFHKSKAKAMRNNGITRYEQYFIDTHEKL